MRYFRLWLVCFLGFVLSTGLGGVQAWSKEGHVMTCQIAQDLLEPQAAHVVRMLLPDYVDGNLSALCVWPDQIRHWYRYRWTSPLHFIDTPDNACSYDYSRDCHDTSGKKDMCVAGAIQNFTSQLSHYHEGSSDRRHNMTEALLFLSHFMGDIHQPMHVGFTSDEGGNTINLRWFRHKSNLHHVWDREIILTAAADFYEKDMESLQKAIKANFTHGLWSEDVTSWKDCDYLNTCINKYATESINLACKWGYKGVKAGETLSGDNRGLALLLPVVPAIAWVLYNIFQPAVIQINKMRTKGVVVGLGIGGGLAASSGLFAPPEAAAKAAEAAANDNRGLYNILQPALNQINKMRN
ncbi:hypothetical protein LXL04_010158 [Taraxacum kok-saghyz]